MQTQVVSMEFVAMETSMCYEQSANSGLKLVLTKVLCDTVFATSQLQINFRHR